jgi:GNAT superfamily N-acetyltransferase
VRIIEKGILDLTPMELRQCKSLSLRHNGLMCEDLRDWRAYESRPNRAKRKARVWMIKDEDDRLLAWALATPKWKGRGYDAQFYTRKSERGKGYGSMLMDIVLDLDPKPYVFPHDKTSGDFFKKHRTTIRFDRDDTKWLNEV